MITLPKVFQTGDLAKTNKVVAFEVSFGDQNQSIFKGVQLDQASIKNTSESFIVLENLARSESGSSAHNVDIGLFDYYRQAAYTCDVTCMGNVMIQPTMYFYLKNIPMFKGTYWITEVTHSIKNGSINTTFKGSRMPYTALPDLSDSFMSSYRALFDKVQKRAIERINGSDKVTETSTTVTNSDGSIYTYDPGSTPLPTGWKPTQEAGITKAGIPYNGFSGSRYISKVIDNSGKEWLRAQVVEMGSTKYQVDDSNGMRIALDSKNPQLLFKDVRTFTEKYQFYATKFVFNKDINVDNMINMTTTFYNESKNKTVPLATNFDLVRTPSNNTPIKFSGAIDIMKDTEPFGIAMSDKLKTDLRLKEGDVIYFNVE
jgi:hypothetical protein